MIKKEPWSWHVVIYHPLDVVCGYDNLKSGSSETEVTVYVMWVNDFIPTTLHMNRWYAIWVWHRYYFQYRSRNEVLQCLECSKVIMTISELADFHNRDQFEYRVRRVIVRSILQWLWYIVGISATMLSRCPPNFKTIWQSKSHSHR